jgi:hypothetical protein
MALKCVVDDPADVPAPLRQHYTTTADGKCVLALDGDPPGYAKSAKVNEFRDNNVALNKENASLKAQLAAFDGIDPAEYQALKAQPTRTAELEAQLAAERAANGAAQLKNTVTYEFLKHGGRPDAVEFMVGNAAKVFTMENGAVTTKEFSIVKPGDPLTVTEWVQQQASHAAFAFLPSRGGGAPPSRPILGATPKAKELRNPTPQELGANATAIARGDIKIVND